MKYIVLYKGPATAPDASHAGWPEWFQRIGDALVDRGSPMMHGTAVRGDGAAAPASIGVNGYSIIQADSIDAARSLVASHPYLALGEQYSVELFEIK
ncbi:MAG TPA: hypothetical protein VKQ34_03000 [Candidatus Saccharimonadales bacterium]|nr:hypothetical protein [Candidatus Saccharimonadales bacterium]